MRRVTGLVVFAMLAALVAATPTFGAAQTRATPRTPTLAQCRTLVKTELKKSAQLTLATDNPVAAPWFINNTPGNQMGYESALAYLIANRLGFAASSVHWIREPYALSYQAGAKPFDFDLNEISYSAARAKNVSFSASYYNLSQSIVTTSTQRIVLHHLPTDLIHYRYGALAGSKSLAYITNYIKPEKLTRVYTTLSAANSALLAGAINAIIIDTPTGYYDVHYVLGAHQRVTVVQLGQFAPVGDLYYAAVFQLNNPLRVCVNVALAVIKAQGALSTINKKWLVIYNVLPVIKP